MFSSISCWHNSESSAPSWAASSKWSDSCMPWWTFLFLLLCSCVSSSPAPPVWSSSSSSPCSSCNTTEQAWRCQAKSLLVLQNTSEENLHVITLHRENLPEIYCYFSSYGKPRRKLISLLSKGKHWVVNQQTIRPVPSLLMNMTMPW